MNRDFAGLVVRHGEIGIPVLVEITRHHRGGTTARRERKWGIEISSTVEDDGDAADAEVRHGEILPAVTSQIGNGQGRDADAKGYRNPWRQEAASTSRENSHRALAAHDEVVQSITVDVAGRERWRRVQIKTESTHALERPIPCSPEQDHPVSSRSRQVRRPVAVEVRDQADTHTGIGLPAGNRSEGSVARSEEDRKAAGRA